jgi:hypothetical protein
MCKDIKINSTYVYNTLVYFDILMISAKFYLYQQFSVYQRYENKRRDKGFIPRVTCRSSKRIIRRLAYGAIAGCTHLVYS